MPSTPLFDASVAIIPAALRDQVPASVLRWVPGQTPLSTLPAASAAIATYLAVIFSGRALMKDHAPFKQSLRIPFFLHNVALSLGSLWLLVLMLEEIVPIILRKGAFESICGVKSWTPHMETFYVINYYFKYYELLDTCFMVLKKKPLAFLHVYHHAATALLCWSQLEGKTSVSWVVISINLAVHVIMYAYYALTSIGIRCPWKKMVTTAQITQFVVDLFIVYFAAWQFYTGKLDFPYLRVGTCAGSEFAAIAGCAVLTSYLFLFVAFYKKTYNAGKAKGANGSAVKANGNGKAVTNGHANGHAKKSA